MLLQVLVNHGRKKATEIDISDQARRNSTWLDWDNRLLSVMTRHLQLYEKVHAIVRTFSNPLDEEGFKMKRYDVSPWMVMSCDSFCFRHSPFLTRCSLTGIMNTMLTVAMRNAAIRFAYSRFSSILMTSQRAAKQFS